MREQARRAEWPRRSRAYWLPTDPPEMLIAISELAEVAGAARLPLRAKRRGAQEAAYLFRSRTAR